MPTYIRFSSIDEDLRGEIWNLYDKDKNIQESITLSEPLLLSADISNIAKEITVFINQYNGYVLLFLSVLFKLIKNAHNKGKTKNAKVESEDDGLNPKITELIISIKQEINVKIENGHSSNKSKK